MRSLKTFLALLLSFQLLQLNAIAQDQKEADFKKACATVVEGLSKQKIASLNSLIHPVYGCYLMYRSGVYDHFEKTANLNSGNYGTLQFDLANYKITAGDIKKYALQFGKLPSYDCGNGVWNRKGFTADSVKKYNPLTRIDDFLKKYEMSTSTKKQMDAAKFIEQHSRKIIFTGSKGEGFIFYLSYINGKWYLSIVDTVTTDCSA